MDCIAKMTTHDAKGMAYSRYHCFGAPSPSAAIKRLASLKSAITDGHFDDGGQFSADVQANGVSITIYCGELCSFVGRL